MLEKIREKKSSALTWAFTIIIIVVFIAFFGPGSFRKTKKGCGVEAYAAKVNGVPISIEQFNYTYQGQRREMQSRMGGKLDRNIEKMMNLKQKVVDELVDIQLLAGEAASYGLSVSDSELMDILMKNSAFQNNGVFDFQLYSKMVRYHFQLSTTSFQEMQRNRLLAIKMLDIVRGAITMDSDEAWYDYQSKNTKSNLWFVAFDPSSLEGSVKVTDAEADSAVKDSMDKIEAYYKAHERDFNKAKKVKARHILIKTPQNATDSDQEAAKAKAEKLIAQIKSGTSLENLAKENSEDPGSKDKGGELGWFEKGQMVPEFEEAAFGMKKGDLTPAPVKTMFGYHIIRVDDIQEAVKTELKGAEKDVAKAWLLAQKAEILARIAAEKTYADLKAGKKLGDLYPAAPSGADVKANNDSNLHIKETGLFSKSSSGAVSQIGSSPELSDEAFKMTTPGSLFSKPWYKVGNVYYVVVFKEAEKADMAKFEKEKASVVEQAVGQKQGAMVQEWIKSLKSGAKINVNESLVSYEGTPEKERHPNEY